jgi:hypothetical protein
MRLLAAIAFMLTLAGSVSAGSLPSEVEYDIFIFETLAGTSVIRFTEEKGMIMADSQLELRFDDEFSQHMTCHTEYDLERGMVVFFSYEGEKAGVALNGTVWADGDSLIGKLYQGGNYFPSARTLSGHVVLFENYIVEHQVLLCRTVASQSEPFLRYSTIFPSEFSSALSSAVLESEIVLRTQPASAVCNKYVFTIQGGSPFYGYYDPALGVPVYMDFPSANTEIFLRAAFPEAQGKYRRPEEQ